MIEGKLTALFANWSGFVPASIGKLPVSGSGRSYFRISGGGLSVIGAWNDDINENLAFTAFSRHFHSKGLPVPEVLLSSKDNRSYLQSDLGDTTLYQLLLEKRDNDSVFPRGIADQYKKVLDWLPEFQISAGRNLDFSQCYPRQAFDRQSMMWDLNYFKYYFLKLSGLPFKEQELEDDFIKLCDLLMNAGLDYFLYRDFQSRNIMIFEDKPFFIDYQGGRKGALQYDVASLLYDGKANLPNQTRDELLRYYLEILTTRFRLNPDEFLQYYPRFTLIRILQALGAYGYRGYYEQKLHFLQSIPFALSNLRFLRLTNQLNFGLGYLMKLIDQMVDESGPYYKQLVQLSEINALSINKLNTNNLSLLTVRINSFSFKKSIPIDPCGNGGGFVFDCRALPNPGREEKYKTKTGMDQDVIDFLEREPSVKTFNENVFSIVNQSVATYIERSFKNLMVSFGCTGGQHRSVYCAETLAKRLAGNQRVKIELHHVEQEEKPNQ